MTTITTEYLVDLIINQLSKKELSEIFYGNQHCGFDNPKLWKRGFKKKLKLEDYSSALENSACIHGMDDYYMGEDPMGYFIPVDKAYIDNKDNVVNAREFWHKNEDAQVLFLTDATDDRIVAFAYHID